MSIHAIDKNIFVENVVIEYRDRPEGSESKLNTYSDGFKVLGTIARLFRTYRPSVYFGIIAAVLAIISIAFFIPVVVEFSQTGVVAKFSTVFVCGFTMLAAIQSLFAGLILKTINNKNKQDFEMNLYRVTKELKDNK